jgi:hypothetical protein
MSEYSLGVEKPQLGDMYKSATGSKQDFLLIDMDTDPANRFRKNFNEIFDIS